MDKYAGYQRSREELLDALRTQIGFLRASCASYDSGSHSEAVRMASSLFILVADGSSRSLLTTLNLRKQIEFISYAHEPVRGNLLADEPVVMIEVTDSRFGYLPVLDQGPTQPKTMKFSKWWEREAVFRTPQGQMLDRKRLVFAMRNQDGGSHLDPRLTDEAYVEFSRKSRWVGTSTEGNEILPNPRPHNAAMRHIAFEFLRSIDASGVLSSTS